MTPKILSRAIIRPALSLLHEMASIPPSRAAERMMVAIAIQETGLKHRVQMNGGPATGLWQFERGGGVAGVLTHPTSRRAALELCQELLVAPTAPAVHQAIIHNDLLAAGFARLLLRTDPPRLPETAQEGWACYLRTWRPGKPHEGTWAAAWAQSEAISGIDPL